MGKNGFLLEAKATEETFAETLAKIQATESLRATLKEGATRTAKKFSMTRTAKKALEYYGEICKETWRERRIERDGVWANLMKRIEVEWQLISDKAECALHALTADEKELEATRARV